MMRHDDVVPATDAQQRVMCVALRMRIEEAGDALVQEMLDLTERPYTRKVGARMTAVLGRVPPPVSGTHWETIAAARNAYRMLSDVLHGRIAWIRIPGTQLREWEDAVRTFEHLAIDLGFHEVG